MNQIKIDITSKQARNSDGVLRTFYGLIAYRLEPPEIVFEIDSLSAVEQEVVSLAAMLTDSNISAEHFEKLLGTQ